MKARSRAASDTARSGRRRTGRLSVDLTVQAGAARRAARHLDGWLEASAPASARGLAAVAVVGDATVRRLNREFRGVDRVTDVLAFPSEMPVSVSDSPPQNGRRPPRLLGDIVIAAGMAGRQARAARHAYATELRILALHGLLHLLGYDHEVDEGRMARAERRLRRRGGLREGLIERSGRR